MASQQNPATAFKEHNHASCAGSVLKIADQLAKETGLRLTPVRRRALEILLTEHRAVGAYDVLEQLVSSGFGHQPPVAYRALEFLVDNGLAHKIGRLNAYMACMQPGREHAPIFFICSDCNFVAESIAKPVSHSVTGAAQEIGFQISRMNIEVVGVCPSCATESPK